MVVCLDYNTWASVIHDNRVRKYVHPGWFVNTDTYDTWVKSRKKLLAKCWRWVSANDDAKCCKISMSEQLYGAASQVPNLMLFADRVMGMACMTRTPWYCGLFE